MEYTSKAVGNAALTTGIIGASGTALGMLAELFGGNRNRSEDSGDRLVTRYEMGLWQDINAKNTEIAALKAAQYADAKADVLQAQLNQNSVWVAGATANMGFMSEQIQKLSGITKTVIPDTNVVTIKTAAVAASDTSAANNG